MFAGLIEDIGTVKNIQKTGTSMDIHIKSDIFSKKISSGDLICANGVSLKVMKSSKSDFMANVVKDMFDRSNLKYLSNGDQINLERSITKEKKNFSNVIQGYVDTTGKIVSKNSKIFTVITLIDYSHYIKKKKTITIDGVSVKIIDSRYSLFSFSLPKSNNALSKKEKGDIVNIEFDIIGKYFKNLFSQSR